MHEFPSQLSHTLDEKFIDVFKKASVSTHAKEREMYLDVLREFYTMELKISQFSALWTRFSDAASDFMNNPSAVEVLRDFTKRLLEANESSAKFGALGGGENGIRCMVSVQNNRHSELPGIVMKNLFNTDIRLSENQSLEHSKDRNSMNNEKEIGTLPYYRKQYIFRSNAPLPGSGSRSTPQRIYFSIPQQGQFRMGAAITEDIVLKSDLQIECPLPREKASQAWVQPLMNPSQRPSSGFGFLIVSLLLGFVNSFRRDVIKVMSSPGRLLLAIPGRGVTMGSSCLETDNSATSISISVFKSVYPSPSSHHSIAAPSALQSIHFLRHYQ
uniref:Uncharacterized protein n=1 Tax=Syphacia muris TaxID=451379 RepID=A0A0N5AJP3_9BILA